MQMHKYITKTYTPITYLYLVFGIIVVGGFVSTFSRHGWVVVLVLGGWLIFSAAKSVLSHRNLKRRPEVLANLIAQNPEQGIQIGNGPQRQLCLATLGAVDEIHNVRDPKVSNLLIGPGWQYCDFSYTIYGHFKYGEYEQARVFYGVLAFDLPRKLPNIFFDSKKARRRQFRFHFARQQRHSLEGDFDKYFVTYFPEQYTVDSLSFISPEVMLALRAAHDYDIEIVSDKLFLYGPLYEPQAQLADMLAKGATIKQKLLNNIITYRDHRLPYEEGRQNVSKLGASLQYSKFWKIVAIITFVLYGLAHVVDAIWH